MAFDVTLAARIRQRLAGHVDVREQRMMGGLCFMLAGHMCCGVAGDGLMVRVGPAAYAAVLSEPHVRPLAMGGRAPKGFVVVAAEGCAGDRALEAWLERAIDFVATLPPK